MSAASERALLLPSRARRPCWALGLQVGTAESGKEALLGAGAAGGDGPEVARGAQGA